MENEKIVESEEEFYNDLRDQPCIVCGDPHAYVLGSYLPDEIKSSINRKDKAPVLYYTLCENCFSNGRIPTARIEAAYRSKFSRAAA